MKLFLQGRGPDNSYGADLNPDLTTWFICFPNFNIGISDLQPMCDWSWVTSYYKLLCRYNSLHSTGKPFQQMLNLAVGICLHLATIIRSGQALKMCDNTWLSVSVLHHVEALPCCHVETGKGLFPKLLPQCSAESTILSKYRCILWSKLKNKIRPDVYKVCLNWMFLLF